MSEETDKLMDLHNRIVFRAWVMGGCFGIAISHVVMFVVLWWVGDR